MLDAGTKTKIDSARDILVGKVPDPKSQVEQITIALIYKFMDDMDRQSEELGGKATFFTGEFKKYRWGQLLDKRVGGHERLLLYAEGIEKMNENAGIPQLFRDIFKGVFLPYRDPETLNLFLKEVNGFTYDHSERLGDAFEYLLSVLGSQGEAGQFRTPRHIIDFIVSLVEPQKGETILDPACGTSGFLISAYRHIVETNTETARGDLLTADDRARLMLNFCGYDISPDMVRLSRANMYLHGFAQPQIHEYDSLTNEERWDERYDVVLANPPFMTPKGGIRPHSRFAIKAKRSEILFVDYIAEHLNPNGRSGVIVPDGIITGKGTANKALQKLLVDQFSLDAVISLPAGVFQPYARAKTSILVFRAGKPTQSIWFCEMSADGYTMDDRRQPCAEDDIPAILAMWQEKANSEKSISVPVGEIRARGYDLRIGRYLPIRVVDNSDSDLSIDDTVNVLTKLASEPVSIPTHPGRHTSLATTTLGTHLEAASRPVTLAADTTYKLLGVKWYGEGPFLREELKGSEIGAKQLFRVKQGDVIYNRLFAWKGSLGIIPEELDGCYVSNEFPVFRIRADQDVYPGFIKHFLKCPTVWKIAEKLSTGTSSTSRNRFAIRDFLDLPFPDIGGQAQKEFVAAIEVLDDLLVRSRTAEALCQQALGKWTADFGPWLVAGWGYSQANSPLAEGSER